MAADGGGRQACGMPGYRRSWVPGGTCFFTVNLADRSRRLLVDNIDALRMGVAAVRVAHPFGTVAWCVLPDHLHVVWTFRKRRTVVGVAMQAPRTRHLATPLLGAPHPRRTRSADRRHPFESGEAWLDDARRRLAAFVFPSVRAPGPIARGLGRPIDIRLPTHNLDARRRRSPHGARIAFWCRGGMSAWWDSPRSPPPWGCGGRPHASGMD